MDAMDQAAPPGLRNDDFDWDAFDPEAYRARCYRTLRDDDRRIIESVRDFLACAGIGSRARGVDVGPAANLYPSLGMLPFCDRIDLLEYSMANVRWLREHLRWPMSQQSWDPFWQVYAENRSYRQYADDHRPLAELGRRATVRQSNLFELPENEWDVGTLFFVACSCTTDLTEFDLAVRCFIRSLKRGAPFAAAFMSGSTGYEVAGRWFPGVPVDDVRVKRSLAKVAYDFTIEPIQSGKPLRPDVGMLLALGRAQGAGRP
jgi:hypothetical protein